MIVHNYGPGRIIATLHVEVDCNGNIMELHDAMDNIEKRIYSELGIQATIHMDPIATNNKDVITLRAQVKAIVKGIDERMDIHDFRCVFGTTHSNILFDMSVPFEIKTGDEELKKIVAEKISEIDSSYFTIVTVDRG